MGKLVMAEGIPGSGKSVAAQTIARRLRAAGRPARWCYEEELGHPVYVFRDKASLGEVVRDLFSGNHARVVAAALERWAAFAAETREADATLVADGVFFGYLTWTLHPLDRLFDEIRAYVEGVEEALAPLDARLVYLRQRDVAATARHVMAVRGRGWAERMIARAVDSPYGRARGLSGVDGFVRFWADYQAVEDRLFELVRLPKLAVDVSVGGWRDVDDAVARFLGLPPAPAVEPGDLARFAGSYRAPDGAVATVELADGALTVRGLHQVWPGQRLVPVGEGAFEVLSLPFAVRFEDGTMRVEGPELLGGRPPAVLERVTG